LLTKNGSLIQTIKILGLSAEQLPKDLLDIRTLVRDTLNNHFNDHDIACWINNVRDEWNIDVSSSYPSFLSSQAHELWQKKNHLTNKFVNVVYISFVTKHLKIENKAFYNFINNLSSKFINKTHDAYLQHYCDKLTELTEEMLNALSVLNPKKLSIFLDDGVYYSENIAFYNRLLQRTNQKFALDTSDVSLSYSDIDYHVGTYKLCLTEKGTNKYVAIVSLKDYHDVPSKALNEVLHLPLNLVITEVFYHHSNDKAAEHLKHQNYILKISEDEEMQEWFNLDSFFGNTIDDSTKGHNNFFSQQISFMICNKDPEELEKNLHNLSKHLANIGLLHVVEDVYVEDGMWAQLPGNFTYLKRLTYTPINNLAAFTSLYSFDPGQKNTSLGMALTILRTNRGNPYYFNFHDLNNRATLAVFGPKGSGKTMITNFLVSEATKYNPKILYLTTNNKSQIFIEGIGGEFADKPFLNPFVSDDSMSEDKLEEFFKILVKVQNVLQLQQLELSELLDRAKNTPKENRSMTNILAQVENNLKNRLQFILQNDDYKTFFSERDELDDILAKDVWAFNLEAFTSKSFYKKYFGKALLPKDREIFNSNLEINNNIKALMLFYILTRFFNSNKNSLKILVIEDIVNIFDHEIFNNFNVLAQDFIQEGNVIINNIETNKLDSYMPDSVKKIVDNIDSKIILAGEKLPISYSEILNISLEELQIINRITLESRLFLFQQNKVSNILELSLGGVVGLSSLLSASPEALDDFEKAKERLGSIDEAVKEIYAQNKQYKS
jgi:type IV secretion system protein VirB4